MLYSLIIGKIIWISTVILKANTKYLSEDWIQYLINSFDNLLKHRPEVFLVEDSKYTVTKGIGTNFHNKEKLQESLNIIEPVVKQKYPNIKFVDCFMRKYLGAGSSMREHTDINDHPDGPYDITLSICLKDNTSWPLWFRYPDGERGYTMEPGYGVLCEAQKIPHWRDTQTIDESTYFIFYHWMLT